MKELRNMSPKPYDVMVYREKGWKKIPTTELLPGDIISLRSYSIPLPSLLLPFFFLSSNTPRK